MIAAARFMIGTQSGSVVRGDEDGAVDEPVDVARRSSIRQTAAGDDGVADAEAGDERAPFLPIS